MGLNAIRLEGKMEDDNFFDLADQYQSTFVTYLLHILTIAKYGILILPGWCCCDAWQHWDAWTDVQ